MHRSFLVSVILILSSGSAERPSLDVYSTVQRHDRANATVHAQGRTAVKGGCPLTPPGSWASRVLNCKSLSTKQGTTGEILICKVDCEGCPDVVLKVTDEGLITNDDGTLSPEQQNSAIEAAVAVNLKSGYLVKGFSSRFMYSDGGDQSMCVYLMEEYANEGSLEDVIEKYDLSTLAIGHIILDVLRGVHDLHMNRVEHHDIKPENIMIVREDGGRLRAKLGDFGEACCMGKRRCSSMERQEDPLHDEQQLKGPDLNRQCHGGRAGYTFDWASPRLVATELDQDRLSKSEPEDDLFTVGKVLYSLFAGKMHTDLEEVVYGDLSMNPFKRRGLKAALAGKDLLDEGVEKSKILCQLESLRGIGSSHLSEKQANLADMYFWELLTHLLTTSGYRVDSSGDMTPEDQPPKEKKIEKFIDGLVSKMRKKPVRARRCEFDPSRPPKPDMPTLKVECALRKAMDWLEAESGRASSKGPSEETQQWISYNKELEGVTRCNKGGVLTRKGRRNQQILDPKEEPEEIHEEPKTTKEEQTTKEVPRMTKESRKTEEEPKMIKEEPTPSEKTGGKSGKMKAKEEEVTWQPQPGDVKEEVANPASLPPGCVGQLNEGNVPEKSFCEGEEGQKGKAKEVLKS